MCTLLHLIVWSFLNALSLCHCPHAVAGLSPSFILQILIELLVCYEPDTGLGPGAMEVRKTNGFLLWDSLTPGQQVEEWGYPGFPET